MNREKAKQIKRAIKAATQNESNLTINEVRIIVAIERAIARLSASSDLAEHLVFKGGFVLLKSYSSTRFTRDADALAVGISKARLTTLLQTALVVDLDDGIWFGDVHIRELNEQGEYGAYRFDCAFQIGEVDRKKIHKLSRIHIDVGFSDKIGTKPSRQIMPSLLEDAEPITWRIYPIEYIIAEKLQTLIERGSANSRAKDVYDLIHLFPRSHARETLVAAIKRTFGNRNTDLPRSFAQQVAEIDRTILSSSWPSVRFIQEKSDFESAWRTLGLYLDKLDEALEAGLSTKTRN